MSDKKIIGFIMHFGYVESTYASVIPIMHTSGWFSSLEEALKDLSWTFFEDFMDVYVVKDQVWAPSLDEFSSYLYSQPERVASGGIGSSSFLMQDSSWWAWSCMHELFPYLDMFYENDPYDAPMENVIPRFLDVEDLKKFSKDRIDLTDFIKEIVELQTPPKDELAFSLWSRISNFIQVGTPNVTK